MRDDIAPSQPGDLLILYEYPFNESIRTMLRLEHLFKRLGFLASRDTPVDHHFMLITQSRNPQDTGVHHCSFEMQDIDALMGAHDYLLACGHELECGVGRHLVGSQIFDYWTDPVGFHVEHFSDGDLVNEHTPTLSYPFGRDTLLQWGPDFPGL